MEDTLEVGAEENAPVVDSPEEVVPEENVTDVTQNI